MVRPCYGPISVCSRPEQRRILMVISDGAPVDMQPCHNPGNFLNGISAMSSNTSRPAPT